MISYWKLDESSGTAYDDYFDGNDGTASAAAPAPSADAVIGGAQSFNGTGNYITVADAPRSIGPATTALPSPSGPS